MSRRLRQELDRIRNNEVSENAEDDVLRMLVDIVARRDALFYPWRLTTADHARRKSFPAVVRRQRDYLSQSSGISAKASGRADWKNAHELRLRLLEFGFATAAKNKGQISSLFVTEMGDATACACIGVDPLPDLSRVIYEYLQLRPGGCFIDGPWLSESKLFQRELYGHSSDWCVLTDATLPLLHRGCIRSKSDTVGRLFYGYVVSELQDPPEVSESKRPWAEDVYFSAYGAERTALENCEYSGNEIYISLPASSFGNCYVSEDVGPSFEHGELRELLVQHANKKE